MLNVEKFLNVWVEVGSNSTSKGDGTITGPSQAPLCLGYIVVSAQFANVLSEHVVFL
jgi:hypothetical protein